MNEAFDKLLCDSFPNLYKDRHGDMRSTCMVWGFPGDGWFLIIWNLSEKLEKMILELPEEERQHCCASQVKEKFGTLRFYMSASSKEMENLIDVAEEQSRRTCETCGQPGCLRKSGWIVTACDEHADGKEPFKPGEW